MIISDMVIKIRRRLLYMIFLYAIFMMDTTASAKGEAPYPNKSSVKAHPAQVFADKQYMVASQKSLPKPVPYPVNESGRPGSEKNDHFFTNQKIFALCIFLAASITLAFNQYRKKKSFAGKLRSLEINMEDQDINFQHLKKEKDWLVEELHHRVKNNLQIVVSLLDSQSAYLTHPEALHAVKSSQHRMYAISLIHQKLYQAESLSIINMEAYINELLQYLQDEYQCNKRISVVLKTIPLKLNLASAIPLGLIINEAVSNILQYAFPKQRQGELKLTLTKDGQEEYLLQIADNGVGLPPEFNTNTPKSLGTILMTGLSQQIHATLEIENNHGVVISVRFKPTPSLSYPLSA